MTTAERTDAERLLAQYAAAEGIASAGDSSSAAAAAATAAAAAAAAAMTETKVNCLSLSAQNLKLLYFQTTNVKL